MNLDFKLYRSYITYNNPNIDCKSYYYVVILEDSIKLFYDAFSDYVELDPPFGHKHKNGWFLEIL